MNLETLRSQNKAVRYLRCKTHRAGEEKNHRAPCPERPGSTSNLGKWDGEITSPEICILRMWDELHSDNCLILETACLHPGHAHLLNISWDMAHMLFH